MGENPKPVKPRLRTWIWVSVLVTVVCGGPLALLVWGAIAFGQAGDPKPVDCAQAMKWAQATLPKSAREPRCATASWLDTYVTADFRMPRAEVAGWLAGTYPGTEPDKQEFCEADLCLNVQYGQAVEPHGPVAVDVKVTYEGETALVRLRAFNT
ncbi:hypothetical protein GPZ77_16295 [Streptomyces sp. QHH-9511]|uniref:hypothetical protein n=1 Tax=Streptomyces sp. QHH-9511 TaxID=2684468 RepID=UPI001316D8E5|nr:hypothetical protein [Streptomyces sp. QHH-9511]QGZ49726.1 hypothetical protein GPZ77_16295 [Streptomyces sp. QHH-9511]